MVIMQAKKTDWIQTYTGKIFYPLEPDIELIDLEDIAHSLSMLCRFTGHCKHFYSVGQHSILVAQNMPDEYRLEGLLHDATEAYLNDMARPVKASFIDYRCAEYNLKLIIKKRFNLKDTIGIVKEIDDALLYWEGFYIMPDISKWNIQKPKIFFPKDAFYSWSPETVEAQFLEIATIEMSRANR